jgi:hypothetical protein
MMDLRIRVYGSGSSITLLSSVILRAAVLQAYNKSCFVDVRLDVDVYIRLCCSLHSAFVKKKKRNFKLKQQWLPRKISKKLQCLQKYPPVPSLTGL